MKQSAGGMLQDGEDSSVDYSEQEQEDPSLPPPPPAVTKHVQGKIIRTDDNDDNDYEAEDLQQDELETGDVGQST